MKLLGRRNNVEEQPEPIERRHRPRLRPVDGAFAFLDLKTMVAGQILNVNEKGLCFRYVASEEHSKESRFVNIIVRGWNFRSTLLPCETVWDQPEPHELSFGPFCVRYCGIRFGALTEKQRLDLFQFINQYAKAEHHSDPGMT